jgi:Mn-containing catalase
MRGRNLNTGSQKDWGITKDSKLYFDLSTPGKYFNELKDPQAPGNLQTEKTH